MTQTMTSPLGAAAVARVARVRPSVRGKLEHALLVIDFKEEDSTISE
eukprot:CAMPEP_0182576354 /NCGR_PEP_ID=MMETSP1324-20130603/33493_1 /TAXON_ID=236786 /ORGANISM="Florenciella sp., Strain RCC1587" /LENGTH=46 /DNA_ID= /DNA_START= /DNA_END= /DNA_ORIENTATION=